MHLILGESMVFMFRRVLLLHPLQATEKRFSYYFIASALRLEELPLRARRLLTTQQLSLTSEGKRAILALLLPFLN